MDANGQSNWRFLRINSQTLCNMTLLQRTSKSSQPLSCKTPPQPRTCVRTGQWIHKAEFTANRPSALEILLNHYNSHLFFPFITWQVGEADRKRCEDAYLEDFIHLLIIYVPRCQIFMAIISGAMQMEGAGEQAEDVASAQGPLDSLLGFLNQVAFRCPSYMWSCAHPGFKVRLVAYLTDWMTGWLTDGRTDGRTDGLAGWLDESVSQ